MSLKELSAIKKKMEDVRASLEVSDGLMCDLD